MSAQTLGFMSVQGPYPAGRTSMRYRAEFIPRGKSGWDRGVGWAPTEKQAREKAIRNARLKFRSNWNR